MTINTLMTWQKNGCFKHRARLEFNFLDQKNFKSTLEREDIYRI